jgi:hypothetical protein
MKLAFGSKSASINRVTSLALDLYRLWIVQSDRPSFRHGRIHNRGQFRTYLRPASLIRSSTIRSWQLNGIVACIALAQVRTDQVDARTMFTTLVVTTIIDSSALFLTIFLDSELETILALACIAFNLIHACTMWPTVVSMTVINILAGFQCGKVATGKAFN